MDVLKEEPSFSHDHFNDVKAASEGQAEPPKASADTGETCLAACHCHCVASMLLSHPYRSNQQEHISKQHATTLTDYFSCKVQAHTSSALHQHPCQSCYVCYAS